MAYQRGLGPLTDPPRCDHGRMVRVTGFSKQRRSYWAAFMCPESELMCAPHWVDVDAIISDALTIWRGFVSEENDLATGTVAGSGTEASSVSNAA